MRQELQGRPAAVPGSDLFLAVEASLGVEGAWDEIVHRYGAMVYGVVSRWGHRNDADDLCQDIFLLLWRKLAQFRGESSLKTWIYQITMNHLRNHASRRVPRRRAEVSLSEDARAEDHFCSTEPSPLDLAQDLEHQALVRRALYELPEIHRECIVLRDLEGLSYDEIATTLGVAEGTVKSRVARARQALMRRLIKRGILN